MKRSICKRLLALTMSLLMLCSLLPMTALAEATPLTLTQALDSAEELTLPYSQLVTSTATYINDYDEVYHFQAYHYKNTGTEEVALYYAAYRNTDMMLRLYQKDEESAYVQTDYIDNDTMAFNGEGGVLTVPAGEEYWILIAPYGSNTSFSVNILFATEDSTEQLIADATAIPSLPYTADITDSSPYFLGGTVYPGSVYSLTMTKDQTILLNTSGDDYYNCTTKVFAASETDGVTDLAELDTGYAEHVPTGAVFQAPADGTYYFLACNSRTFKAVEFTGTYRPASEATEPTYTPVTELPFTATKQIGGAAGEYLEDEWNGVYYGLVMEYYSLPLTEGQKILPNILLNGKAVSGYAAQVFDPDGNGRDVDLSTVFTAPATGEYKWIFPFDYPWESTEITFSLQDASTLPGESDLIAKATTLVLNETATKDGVESLVNDTYGMAAAFSLDVKAGTHYHFKGNPTSQNYILEKTETGYGIVYAFGAYDIYTPETDTTLYIVSIANDADPLSMIAREAINNPLDFTYPDNLPVAGEDDLWSWDNDTLTLTLKDGFTLFGGYTLLYLPDGATIIVEGEASLENLMEDCIYAEGNLTICGKEVDEDGNPTATLNIISGDDGVACYNLTVEDLNLNIHAESDGLLADGWMTMTNCDLTVYCGDDAIDVYEDATITDSKLSITTPTGDAIFVGSLTMDNCDTTLIAGHPDEDGDFGAIDVGLSVAINGGSLSAVSYSTDAIRAEGSVTIAEGTEVDIVTHAEGYAAVSCADLTLPDNIIVTDTSVVTLERIAIPTAVTGLIYNGAEQTGVLAGTGYTLTGNTAKDAGTYTATATLEEGCTWSDGSTDAKEIAWSIAQREVRSMDLSIAPIPVQAYTGEAVEPPVTVTCFGETLQEGVDYLVTYTDNIQIGTATVSLSPANKGNYIWEGGVMTSFTITVTSPHYGDLNGNDQVTAEDALLALQIATSKVMATDVQAIVGDVDNTVGISANDALLILQHATRKIDQFPVEAAEDIPDDGDQGIGSGDGAEDNIG